MPGADEKESEFVSQDEIDRLLGDEKEASFESNTPSEETAKEASFTGDDGGMQPAEAPPSDSPAEEDSRSDGDPPPGKPIADRVILEEVPEEFPSSPPVLKRRRGLALGKQFWIAASIAVVLGTAANTFLWVGSRERLEPAKPEILTFPVVNAPDVQPPSTLRISPLSVVLKGFLVPAPEDRKDLTYITLDVSIELTHAKAASLIKAHTPFYRNIIYEAISDFLKTIDKGKFNEIGLKLEILKAVNRSFPERSVRDVAVDAFVMF